MGYLHGPLRLDGLAGAYRNNSSDTASIRLERVLPRIASYPFRAQQAGALAPNLDHAGFDSVCEENLAMVVRAHRKCGRASTEKVARTEEKQDRRDQEGNPVRSLADAAGSLR